MQSNHVVLVSVLTILMTTVHAQKKKPQELPFQKFTYKTKSDTLPYALLTPVDKTQKYPLIIFLHGKAERGKDNVQQLSHINILFNTNTYAKYPWLAYGTDWLAFAHLVIALFFIGPFIDPLKNVWVIRAGLAACVLVPVLALICGPIRQIPFGWRLIDSSFGVIGAIPLLYALRLTKGITR